MSLESLLTVKRDTGGVDYDDLVTEEGLSRNLPALRDAVSYWRCYPDRFVDFLVSLDGSSTFKFKEFQRIMLRAILRHRYVYIVMTRGTSKSFISVMAMMVKAILYPRCKLFVASGNKEQSATILQEKVSEICRMIPAFRNEIVWDTRAAKNVSDAHTRQNKDSAVYSFKNGSTLCNVVAGEQTRGRRFQCGLTLKFSSR
jgi:hypothetical protein